MGLEFWVAEAERPAWVPDACLPQKTPNSRAVPQGAVVMPLRAVSASSSSWRRLKVTRMLRKLQPRSGYGGVGTLGGTLLSHPCLTPSRPLFLIPVPMAGPTA